MEASARQKNEDMFLTDRKPEDVLSVSAQRMPIAVLSF
jgi:hypothetical protein